MEIENTIRVFNSQYAIRLSKSVTAQPLSVRYYAYQFDSDDSDLESVLSSGNEIFDEEEGIDMIGA